MSLRFLILCVISFLDSLCSGLVMPILPTHLLILGGTHTILGVHGMCFAALQLFSFPFSRTLMEKFGKKSTLKTTLLIATIIHIYTGSRSSYSTVIVFRIVFYLVNQTQNVVRGFVKEFENSTAVQSKLDLLGIFGFIIGPIIGGYMFEGDNGFYNVCILTGTLIFVCSMLTNYLPQDKTEIKEKSGLKHHLKEEITSVLTAFQHSDLIKNRTIFTLRFLISFSLTIFFIKFSLLLKTNYLASHSLVGWTIAFQNFSILLSTFSLSFLQKYLSISNIYKLRRFLSVLAISSTAICFAPTYEIYLISFLPLALSKVLVDSAWKEIEESQRKANPRFSENLQAIVAFTNVFAPVVLGVLCDIYVQNAVKMLTVIPLVFASFIGSYYYVGSEKKNYDKKKE